MTSGASLVDGLSHVYWMGGSPCSGKSSIADRLAAAYGLTLYRCDDAFYRHARIITPGEQPVFHRIMGYSPEALWMRPVEQQAAEEIEIYREEFPLILADLRDLGSARPILAEGAALLPELVQPLLPDMHRAIWVVPTAGFQMAHYRQRAWAQKVVSPCSDPEQAFQNWMNRDIRFASYVRQTAQAQGGRVLLVDGVQTIEENTAQVQRHFGFERQQPFIGKDHGT